MKRTASISTWVVILSLLTSLVLVGCVSSQPRRAVGIPSAATRTPDFALPLSNSDRSLALLYLDDKRPPGGSWMDWDEEEIQDELEILTLETRQGFEEILGMLSRVTPGPEDLAASGSIGSLFEGAGADDEALDARLMGQIMTGDLRVGKLHGYYFIFYRRYPECGNVSASCRDVDCPELQYCRLVIVDETATRRD